MQLLNATAPGRWTGIVPFAAGVVVTGVLGLLFYWNSASARTSEIGRTIRQALAAQKSARADASSTASAHAVVALSRDQQEAIGLTVVRATPGVATDVIDAPGQIVPDESKFAYITPRAAGIVRMVKARLGQDVQAGTLLAMIDSPEVAKARFALFTCDQELTIAQKQAEWQETTFKNTKELVEQLRANAEPGEIQKRFQNRTLGGNREQLLTAYAKYLREIGTLRQNEGLIKDKVITPTRFREVRADYEMAQATYQGQMDQMEYNNNLANLRAQQTLLAAETALRVAREQLRVLGVRPDGTEPEIKDGKVVGVLADGSLPVEPGKPADSPKPEPIVPAGAQAADSTVMPVGAPADADPNMKDLPVSTYAIWAPFDGTVLDREQILPGVYVDTTHRIFTLADLSSVWIEVAIHEGRYGALSRSRDATLILSSPAYPGRHFTAAVIYTGDMVDPKSRSIKLLARAENRDRALKPGMWVTVALHLKGTLQAILIPEAAIVTEDRRKIVFVQTGPERFEQRIVDTGASDGDKVAVLKGIEKGDKVVVEGAFKLRSKAMQVAE